MDKVITKGLGTIKSLSEGEVYEKVDFTFIILNRYDTNP